MHRQPGSGTQNGASLAEVLAALLIACIVAAPLAHIFISSARNNAAAARFTQASLAAHSALEQMQTLTYTQAFAAQGAALQQGITVTTTVRPFGVFDAMAANDVQYAHLIIQPDFMLFAGPDGQLHRLPRQDISVQANASAYTLKAGDARYTGAMTAADLLLVVLCGDDAPLQIACGNYVQAVVYARPDAPLRVLPAANVLADLRNDTPPAALGVLVQCTAGSAPGGQTLTAREVLELEIP